MNVSLYLYFEKIRVAFYTIEAKTIVIYNLEINRELTASIFFYHMNGSKFMASI